MTNNLVGLSLTVNAINHTVRKCQVFGMQNSDREVLARQIVRLVEKANELVSFENIPNESKIARDVVGSIVEANRAAMDTLIRKLSNDTGVAIHLCETAMRVSGYDIQKAAQYLKACLPNER